MWNTLSNTHKNIVILFSVLVIGISTGYTLREWSNLGYRLNQHVAAESVKDSIFDARMDHIEVRINVQNDSINKALTKIQLSICEMVAADIVQIRQCRK